MIKTNVMVSKVEPLPAQAKGIGNSITISHDIEEKEEACQVLLQLSDSVGSRLRKAKKAAGMVSCEIKYHTFQNVSHQTTLPAPTDSSTIIYETACLLFDELWNGTPIRLLGIRTSKLSDIDEPVQLNLFDYNLFPKSSAASKDYISIMQQKGKQEKLDKALDEIRHKYGTNAVIRGSLLKNQNP